MTDDLLVHTLNGITSSIKAIEVKIDKLDDKVDTKITQLNEKCNTHKVQMEGRLTKVETKSGIIAAFISAFVAAIGLVIGVFK